ncbi:MAG: hypothetical protein ACOC2U_00905 [bacterium]
MICNHDWKFIGIDRLGRHLKICKECNTVLYKKYYINNNNNWRWRRKYYNKEKNENSNNYNKALYFNQFINGKNFSNVFEI